MAGKYNYVEYICSCCGMRTTRGINLGRPSPGYCSRKPRDSNGRQKPHTWVISRKY